VTALHKLLDELVDILGGCEHLENTNAFVIYVTLKTLLFIYFLLLPFAQSLVWLGGPVHYYLLVSSYLVLMKWG